MSLSFAADYFSPSSSKVLPVDRMLDEGVQAGVIMSPTSLSRRPAPAVMDDATGERRQGGKSNGSRAPQSDRFSMGFASQKFRSTKMRLSFTIQSVAKKGSALRASRRLESRLECCLPQDAGKDSLEDVRIQIAELTKILHGPNSSEHLEALLKLGEAQLMGGKHEEARTTLERVIASSLSDAVKKDSGDSEPDEATTTLRNILGRALELIAQSRWRVERDENSKDELIVMLERSLDLQRNNHEACSRILILLSRMHRGSERGLVYSERAVEEGEKAWGQSHPNLARACMWVADEAHRQADHKKALSFSRKSLDIEESCFGKLNKRLSETLDTCIENAVLAKEVVAVQDLSKWKRDLLEGDKPAVFVKAANAIQDESLSDASTPRAVTGSVSETIRSLSGVTLHEEDRPQHPSSPGESSHAMKLRRAFSQRGDLYRDRREDATSRLANNIDHHLGGGRSGNGSATKKLHAGVRAIQAAVRLSRFKLVFNS